MADLPREVAEGIEAARPEAEAKLRAALGKLSGSPDRVETWLPAFQDFAVALFDGGARGASGLFSDRNETERFLGETLLGEVVEGMMPERSLREALAGEKVPRPWGFVHEDDGGIYEAEPYEARGERVAAPRAIQVPHMFHGDVERFLSEAGFCWKLFPDEWDEVRRGLGAHLNRRVCYLARTLAKRRAKGARGTASPPVSALPDGAQPQRWEDIEIRFFNKETVQVTTPTQTWNAEPVTMGFVSKRNKRAVRAWDFLHKLAEHDGNLPVPKLSSMIGQRAQQARRTGKQPGAPDTNRELRSELKVGADLSDDIRKSRQTTQKRLQEIRERLRKYFRLEGNPIPFVSDWGYRTAFKLRA